MTVHKGPQTFVTGNEAGRTSRQPVPVAVAHGDGIGPEIMAASLEVLSAAGANIRAEPVSIGEQAYLDGHTSGIPPHAWDTLRSCKVFYKAPITTPQGGGYKSLNVTIRKALGLYANIRPCTAYAPFVPTKHPDMDVVIVRENEEDLYAGIEHRQTDEVYQCLKIISRPGCERIIRHAFEYARANGRRKVTCFSKDNIMKLTDGLFHKVFDEIGAEYPDLEKEHLIIDIGAARLAAAPERFDVIVTLNLYGDIVSDIAAEVAGSVGLAGSGNIGEQVAMFEAIHGSAPDIAGKDVANPSGLLLSGVMMLVHIGQSDVAEKIHNAWLKTIEDGIHTADIYDVRTSARLVGTREFAAEVIARLGREPETFTPVRYETKPLEAESGSIAPAKAARPTPRAHKQTEGVDVFVHWDGENPDVLARQLKVIAGEAVELAMITNRGIKVWPEGLPETFTTDHWRCRFMLPEGENRPLHVIADLQCRLAAAGVNFIKTEHLCTFDDVPGYSLGQGQ